jgi:hypothetical protein
MHFFTATIIEEIGTLFERMVSIRRCLLKHCKKNTSFNRFGSLIVTKSTHSFSYSQSVLDHRFALQGDVNNCINSKRTEGVLRGVGSCNRDAAIVRVDVGEMIALVA